MQRSHGHANSRNRTRRICNEQPFCGGRAEVHYPYFFTWICPIRYWWIRNWTWLFNMKPNTSWNFACKRNVIGLKLMKVEKAEQRHSSKYEGLLLQSLKPMFPVQALPPRPPTHHPPCRMSWRRWWQFLLHIGSWTLRALLLASAPAIKSRKVMRYYFWQSTSCMTTKKTKETCLRRVLLRHIEAFSSRFLHCLCEKGEGVYSEKRVFIETSNCLNLSRKSTG